MNEQTFLAISDKRLSALIRAARRRVILATPALHESTGKSLVDAHQRLGAGSVRIVIDCSEKVFRLGYGQHAAVEALIAAGCDLRQSAGLRVGVLVVDGQAWVFAPAALYVEDEVHSDETPNAVCLQGSDVEALAASVVPESALPSGTPNPTRRGDAADSGQPEIGIQPITRQQIEEVGEGLSIAPPVPFDVARQVRVFQPYLQYVEISLRGCAIQRHRVQLPKSILAVDSEGDLSGRLRTTFDLIEKSSAVSSVALDAELLRIREAFTRSIGKPWGRVMLKATRARFDEAVCALRDRLKEHEAAVRETLQSKISESKQQIVEAYAPLVQERPPVALLAQIVHSNPSIVDCRRWLEGELTGVFPTADALVAEMALEVTFRDVTYETLNEPGFHDRIQAAFPMVRWGKPFEEFVAAKASGGPRS